MVITPLVAMAADTPEDEFRAAENTFRFQDFKEAERRLKALLYPEVRLTNPDQVLKAREYLGAVYFWLGDEKAMEGEFTALLVLAPLHKLDPFYYPAPLIERFEALRKRLAELKVISLEPPARPAEPPRCERQEVTVVRRSRLVSLMPFGIGQFQNAEPVKGGLFLGGELLTLGLNIGAYVAAEALRGDDGLYSPANASRARSLRYVQYASLGAFVALVVWGVIDSTVRFQPEEKQIHLVPCPGPKADAALTLSICARY